MKRRIMFLMMAGCLCFSACGLNDKQKDAEKSEDTIIEDDSIDDSILEQLQTFYNTKSQWEIVDGHYDNGDEGIDFDNGYAYAITDIDDGNLEILMSGMAGRGLYSTNIFYEYSGKDKIVKMDTSNFGVDGSEPDLINFDYFAGREMSYNDGAFHYCFEDYQGYGISGGKTIYYDVSIENNT